MHEKELPPPLDAALSQVDPERRRLLGILLAGAAALPLLNSTTLGAQEKTAAQSKNQNTRQTPIKHAPMDLKTNSEAIKSDTQIKGDRTIKMNSQIKNSTNMKNATWVKGGVTASDSSQIKGDSSQIKASSSQIKSDATMKSSAQIKSSTIKSSNSTIKSSSTPQQ